MQFNGGNGQYQQQQWNSSGQRFQSFNNAANFKRNGHMLFRKCTYNTCADLRAEYDDTDGEEIQIDDRNCEICAVVYDQELIGLHRLLKEGSCTLIPVHTGRDRDRTAHFTAQFARVLDLDRPDEELDYLLHCIKIANEEMGRSVNHVLKCLRSRASEKKRRQRERARMKWNRLQSSGSERHFDSEYDDGRRDCRSRPHRRESGQGRHDRADRQPRRDEHKHHDRPETIVVISMSSGHEVVMNVHMMFLFLLVERVIPVCQWIVSLEDVHCSRVLSEEHLQDGIVKINFRTSKGLR